MTEINNEINANNTNQKNAKALNSNAIKLIAIIAMTIDHIAWAVFPNNSLHPLALIMHILGRITCPIMCFCIAEGYHYTKDIKKYTFRLFLFALISHVPYMLQTWQFKTYGWLALVPFATGDGFMGHILNQTSVMWSLAIGLVMLRINYSEKIKSWLKPILIILLCLVAFPADWSCIASLFVLCIGSNRNAPLKQILWCSLYLLMYALIYFFFISEAYAIVQFGVVLSIPIIAMYNGKRGANPKVNKFMKWFFYIYYPLHLTIIGIILLI